MLPADLPELLPQRPDLRATPPPPHAATTPQRLHVLQPRAVRQLVQDLLTPILKAGRYTHGPLPARVSHDRLIQGHLQEILIADHRQAHPATDLHQVPRLLTAQATAPPVIAVRAIVLRADQAAPPAIAVQAIALRTGQAVHPAIAGPVAVRQVPAGQAVRKATADPALLRVQAIQGPAAVHLHHTAAQAAAHPIVREAVIPALRAIAHPTQVQGEEEDKF
jgi:hypothetical protein